MKGPHLCNHKSTTEDAPFQQTTQNALRETFLHFLRKILIILTLLFTYLHFGQVNNIVLTTGDIFSLD